MLNKKDNRQFGFSIIILAALIFSSCSSNISKHQTKEPQQHHQIEQTSVENVGKSSEHVHRNDDPHMKMTALREPQPGDRERAAEIANRARRSIEKYKDYRVALRDGFEILLPKVPQKMYHFNKLQNYIEAESSFNPERPTSLLYEKTSDGYRLIGVMYTAPTRMSENELNERIPLSITQWHQHVNICLPKGVDQLKGIIGQGSRFGIEGSITTKEECDKAGGQFLPRLLGWMVHLYPYEQATEAMWSVERQMNDGGTHHGH